MAGYQPTDRIISWLAQSGPSSPGGPRSNLPADSQSGEHSHNSGSGSQRSTLTCTSCRSSRINQVLGQDILPQDIPLPESYASSSNGSDLGTDPGGSRDSQDYLNSSHQHTPPAVATQAPEVHMQTTPQVPRPIVIAAPYYSAQRPVYRQRYQRTLDNAASVLDHIRDGNVCKSSRHDRTYLIHYDYSRQYGLYSKEIQDAREIWNLANTRNDVYRRVLVVQDLSRSTIHALGETFRINPEFFEEHLLNSGYAGAEYDMLPAKMWTTAALEKSYASTKWIRPVYRLPMYSWNYRMQDIAKTGMPESGGSYTSGESGEDPSNQSIVEHFTRYGTVRTRVATNIFRSESRLWTNPDQANKTQRECGLEERISIWRGRLAGGCEIVIILTDPLPMVEELHPCDETTNFELNKFWGRVQRSKNEVKVSLEESDGDEWAERGISREAERHSPFRATGEPLLMQWARSLKKLAENRKANMKNDSFIGPFSIQQSLQKIIIKEISPRHTVAADLDRIFESEESTGFFETRTRSSSTLYGLCDEIQQHGGPILLGSSVFHIIKQDTLTFLRRLSHYGLDEMEVGVLDETKMEDQLSTWIQAISHAQREIAELQACLEPFVAFCASLDAPHVFNANEPVPATEPKVLREFQQLSEMITQMSDRLQRTSALLTSNLGLLESRRSINEAQAVSRLTELAFVFVPLSFAASIFGMQVQSFADPVPLRSFFIVAVGVTLFAYFMRMTMRSQWLAYLKVVLRSDVRKYAESHGLPVPTRSISILLMLQWIVHHLGVGVKKSLSFVGTAWIKIWRIFGFLILFILLNGVIAGIPVGIIWSRDLSPDIQCAVTIAIVMLVVGSVGTSFWNWCEPEFRSALPILIGRFFKYRSYPSVKVVLISGTTVVTMVVSLALLWTRPLALGIKSGLTIGILLFVVPLIVGLIFNRVMSF
ncbi:unnamed protein product [Penicillium olsonii]|uniref:Uncharacterized protein n=1 Tax=Penicillium olsonii TaxID=99116 RepID=A0A9W4IJG8_PENOL|nr:unnamed protein product [Penicillium olsonii]CAG8300737.1 unnamed protein product [Penicillium olsonii]